MPWLQSKIELANCFGARFLALIHNRNALNFLQPEDDDTTALEDILAAINVETASVESWFHDNQSKLGMNFYKKKLLKDKELADQEIQRLKVRSEQTKYLEDRNLADGEAFAFGRPFENFCLSPNSWSHRISLNDRLVYQVNL